MAYRVRAITPGEFVLHGRTADCDVALGGDNVAFVSVGGAPHISDLDRGKRAAAYMGLRRVDGQRISRGRSGQRAEGGEVGGYDTETRKALTNWTSPITFGPCNSVC